MFFQNTIIRKYIASLPEEQFTMAWEQYKSYFLVPAVLTPCARPRYFSKKSPPRRMVIFLHYWSFV